MTIKAQTFTHPNSRHYKPYIKYGKMAAVYGSKVCKLFNQYPLAHTCSEIKKVLRLMTAAGRLSHPFQPPRKILKKGKITTYKYYLTWLSSRVHVVLLPLCFAFGEEHLAKELGALFLMAKTIRKARSISSAIKGLSLLGKKRARSKKRVLSRSAACLKLLKLTGHVGDTLLGCYNFSPYSEARLTLKVAQKALKWGLLPSKIHKLNHKIQKLKK